MNELYNKILILSIGIVVGVLLHKLLKKPVVKNVLITNPASWV